MSRPKEHSSPIPLTCQGLIEPPFIVFAVDYKMIHSISPLLVLLRFRSSEKCDCRASDGHMIFLKDLLLEFCSSCRTAFLHMAQHFPQRFWIDYPWGWMENCRKFFV